MGAVRAESLGPNPASAQKLEHIRVPEDLELPEGLLDLIRQKLTPDGAQVFAEQIVDAIDKSVQERDLIHIHTLLESWYRTLRFVERGRFDEDDWEKANMDDPVLSLDDVRKRLDLA